VVAREAKEERAREAARLRTHTRSSGCMCIGCTPRTCRVQRACSSCSAVKVVVVDWERGPRRRCTSSSHRAARRSSLSSRSVRVGRRPSYPRRSPTR
jgi:hypothetical protein